MATITKYINEKLPTFDDLRDLDSLVAMLDEQQSALSLRIADKQDLIVRERDALVNSSNNIISSAIAVRAGHAKLKARLVNATFRARSPFLDTLQTRITTLEHFETARSYVRSLEEVQRICNAAKVCVVRDPAAAQAQYRKLVELAELTSQASHTAEESAVHLVEFLQQSRECLWRDLRELLAAAFRATLDCMSWPKMIAPNIDCTDFTTEFKKLLEFQFSSPESQLLVIAMQVMVEPLSLRFHFHFEGNKDTNNITKPEWFLQHFSVTVEEHEQFLRTTVQPIFEAYPPTAGKQAVHEFIYAYLPCLERKLEAIIPVLLKEPQLLSHLMLETMKFDDFLRDRFLFEESWSGVLGVVLRNHQSWFDSWLATERDFALSRYQEIIGASDAWVIDFDAVSSSADNSAAAPTRSALRLRDLLDAILERYRPLRSFMHRIRFLMDIQIALLESYHARISASLDAFESLTSSLARAVVGVNEEDRKKMIDGLAGIERLCRAHGSAYTIRDALDDWGESIFFLELYQELNRRASAAAGSPKKTTTGIEKYSDKLPDAMDEDGTIFDEIIKAYNGLQTRAEGLILKHLQREVQKVYKSDSTFRQAIKSRRGEKDLEDEKSSNVDAAEQVIRSSPAMAEMLAYLSRALSAASYGRVSGNMYRSFAFLR
ncbi:TIP-1 family-domain-containing protein [Limtongia smithiae]|uniref:TIP-1 family-domain-containing protein n=1 Tax=Limtongia smithiae TaxID=1125753 RepID=UPI0034D00AE6